MKKVAPDAPRGSVKLGRSAATGQVVLAPAKKRASTLTEEKVRSAVRAVIAGHKA